MPKAGTTRRDFIRRTAAALTVPYAASSAFATDAAGVAYAYVGTYTPNGGGIYLFRIDRSSGALTQLQVTDDIRNPSWLAVNPAQTRLYAISEIDNFQGSHSGAVVSYAIDADSLRIARLGAVSSAGTTPAHLSVHPSGKFVFVANYGGGNVAVFPVGADGALGEATDVRPSVGPRHHARAIDDPSGQFAVSDHDSPHLHMVAPDPSGQFVIANDAGLDLTLIWRFDAQAGRLLPADVPVIAAPSGSAPRHFVFHPNGRVFYNLYEHDAKVAVYDYDPARGGLRPKQTLSTLPPRFAGSNLAAEILITPDGRFLYVSNRIHNALDGVRGGRGRAIAHGVRDLGARGLAAQRGDRSERRIYFFLQSEGRLDHLVSHQRLDRCAAFTGRFEPVGSPAVMLMLRPREH